MFSDSSHQPPAYRFFDSREASHDKLTVLPMIRWPVYASPSGVRIGEK
jgi:hypothetical protein